MLSSNSRGIVLKLPAGAAGALAGNDTLRARGRKDQAVGRVKPTDEKGVRQAKKSSRKIVEKAKNIARGDAAKSKSRR